jgi:hypothetical protein
MTSTAHPISLFILTVLVASTLTGCEDAKNTQAIKPVDEKTDLVSSDVQESEVAPLIPPPITADADERALTSTAPTPLESPATISSENGQIAVDESAVNQSNDPENISSRNKGVKAAKVVMPKKLRGIWSDNNADGKSQCERYRLATRRGRTDEDDELSNSLVGSLVITRHMIHAYSDYGEGNFYAIKQVSRMQGDKWNVTAQLGIDFLPYDEVAEDMVALELHLSSGLLYWKDEDVSSRYFRCSDLTCVEENIYLK